MAISNHVSLIIPAHNEAGRIGNVIEPALASDCIDSVIIIDDGSTDTTADEAADFDVSLIRHGSNLGKSEAMHSGYLHAKSLGSSALLFLDADLHNLNSTHIDSLIYPVIYQTASMTIGILERTKLQKAVLMKWGAFSGQRALPISLWEELKPKDRKGFSAEAALNSTTRHLGTHHQIQRVLMNGVTHTGKREKEPTLVRAGAAYAKTYGQALLTYARLH